ncbi:hypothetical protein GUJ93_ZPchr0012g22187 [Zizania palustris]|uniref:Uncharacterized protein n=1 Tax=Zizania palustris TaxID=103762 RepID=A0A8J6BSK6_ZIZPA|nr:hypothetical protein GUJ93_ZPchr0012g22187 [Zizania palustris]
MSTPSLSRPTFPALKPSEADLPVPKPSTHTPTPPLPRQASTALEPFAHLPRCCQSRPPPLWCPPHVHPSATEVGLSRHGALCTTSPGLEPFARCHRGRRPSPWNPSHASFPLPGAMSRSPPEPYAHPPRAYFATTEASILHPGALHTPTSLTS